MSGAADAVPDWARQHGHRIRFDWGPHGLRALGPVCDVVVVVDVLRFTTCVDVAVGRGAVVHPYPWRDDGAATYARSVGAELAGERWSLSPSGLSGIPAGTKLVLPSPNGSALSRSAAEDHGARVLAGCLRNARAVGRAAARFATVTGGNIAVLAAGERWRSGGTGPLRPAVEDLWGAGAVVSAALGVLGEDAASPEARAAAAAVVGMEDAAGALRGCASGQELVARGEADDLDVAARVDASDAVPTLLDGAFRRAAGGVGELGA